MPFIEVYMCAPLLFRTCKWLQKIKHAKTLQLVLPACAWSQSRIVITFFAIRSISELKGHAFIRPQLPFLCIACNQEKKTCAIFRCYCCVVRSLTDCYINLQRLVGLPELRSLRRTFIKLAGQYSLSGPPPPTDADSAKRMFVDYLNREIGAWWFSHHWRVSPALDNKHPKGAKYFSKKDDGWHALHQVTFSTARNSLHCLNFTASIFALGNVSRQCSTIVPFSSFGQFGNM